MMSYSWEDKHFFRFILDEVLAVNNKRNQLKIKGIKVFSSKQSMTSSESIKTKIYWIELKNFIKGDHHSSIKAKREGATR